MKSVGEMAVRKLNNGKWEADFYLNGKRVKKQQPTKRAATNYIVKRMSTEVTALSTAMEENFNSLKVSDIAWNYLNNHLLESRASSNASYVYNIIKRWGSFTLSQVGPKEVKEWVKEMVKSKSYAISTIQKYLTYFQRIFSYAIEEELIAINPIKHISFSKLFKLKNKRNFTISLEDFPKLLNLFEKGRWYQKPIILMLWHTGMRIGEVLSLQWTDVNLDRGVITLDANRVKEGKIRTIGLENEMIDVLKKLRVANLKKGMKSKIHIFGVTKDNPLNYNTFYKNYRAVVDGTRFSHYNIHDIRHSYTKRKRQEGHDREVIKIQQGHTSNSMFDWYNDIDVDEVTTMAGLDTEKRELIEEPVKELMDFVKDNDIPIGTLQSIIRKNI